MNIAVVGAGAVGSLVGGLLARAGENVLLIGRKAHVDAINANGLLIDGVLGTLHVKVKAQERLDFTPDVVLLAVKTQSVAETAREIQPYVAGVAVVTMQNGVRCDDMVADALGRKDILSCVVMLGVTYLEPGRITYARQGALMLGVPFSPVDDRARRIAGMLDKAIPTALTSNIKGARWAKVIVNENNALPAITGLSINEINRRPELRRLATLLMKEAAATIKAADITLASLPQLSATMLRLILSMPTPIAGLLPRMMARSMGTTPVLGSTLQSIKRGEKTEIDYLNGEVVALGKSINKATPYNDVVVQLVHRVEATGTFMTEEQVMAAVKQSPV
jgi:2-dehydropantoate 2-reductase